LLIVTCVRAVYPDEIGAQRLLREPPSHADRSKAESEGEILMPEFDLQKFAEISARIRKEVNRQ
jgi:hypothetical protein